MEELWKYIEGYESKYQVSNLGNVRSLDYRHTGKTQILQPVVTTGGYLNVVLFKDGKRDHRRVHRLVISRHNISTVCYGKRQTAGGFHWEFVTNSAREQSALGAPGEGNDG